MSKVFTTWQRICFVQWSHWRSRRSLAGNCIGSTPALLIGWEQQVPGWQRNNLNCMILTNFISWTNTSMENGQCLTFGGPMKSLKHNFIDSVASTTISSKSSFKIGVRWTYKIDLIPACKTLPKRHFFTSSQCCLAFWDLDQIFFYVFYQNNKVNGLSLLLFHDTILS